MTAPTLIGPVLDEVIDHLTIVELEQHLDDEVPCMLEQGCDQAAHWAVRCPSCGTDWTGCSPHRLDRDEQILAVMATSVRCSFSHGCGVAIPTPLNWRPL